MAELIATWKDTRPAFVSVTYRLVRADTKLILERAEKDSLGGDRWTCVGGSIPSDNNRECLLALVMGVEALAKQLHAHAVRREG